MKNTKHENKLFFIIGLRDAFRGLALARLLPSYCHELDNTNINHYILTKFPAEAFLGIEEAHDSGLKVAIAYPNPGKDVLNIRTGLQNARVEIYDTNGRLIHRQALTENVTSIDAKD